jgi:exosortase A-associated hydrolase 1
LEYREIPLFFDCNGASLLGVLAVPVTEAAVGVLIVVGGPQYRVGSHRQFVHLARALAASGIACMRFDYRGMGDSEGDRTPFDASGPDIGAAIGAFQARMPKLKTIVLWGLCDGAAACAFVGGDERVGGMVLVNPWVHEDATSAEATLRHYYVRRILQPGFWRKLGKGRFGVLESITDLFRNIRSAAGPCDNDAGLSGDRGLVNNVARGIAVHRGPILVVLSGNDLTAAEFKLASRKPGLLRSALEERVVMQVEIPDADHTLSDPRWRDHVSAITLQWLHSRFPSPSRATA